MALVVGTNSWISLAEAETYFSERIESEPWDNLPDDVTKEKYLISAYRWLFYYTGITAPASATEDAVKYGQCDAALFMISFYDDYNNRTALYAAGVRDFKKSKWEEELAKATLPDTIINYFDNAGYWDGGEAAMVDVSDDNTCY